MEHIPKIPLKNTTSRNCWDTFLSACPLNVGVQDMVTKLQLTTLRGRRGARKVKKLRLVEMSQLFLSSSVARRVAAFFLSEILSFLRQGAFYNHSEFWELRGSQCF